MTLFKRLLKLGLILTLLLLTLSYVLLNTQVGLNTAVRFLPEEMKVGNVSGTLMNLTVKNATYAVNGSSIGLETLRFNWRAMGLLRGRVDIESIELNKLTVQLLSADKEDEKVAKPYLPWAGLDLPVDITINRGLVSKLLVTEQGNVVFALDSVSIRGRVVDNVADVREFKVLEGENRLDLAARIDLANTLNGKVELTNSVDWSLGGANVILSGSLDGDWSRLKLTQDLDGPIDAELNSTFVNVHSPKIGITTRLTSTSSIGAEMAGHPISVTSGEINADGEFTPSSGVHGIDLSITGDSVVSVAGYQDWAMKLKSSFNGQDLSLSALELNQAGDDGGYISISGLIKDLIGFSALSAGEANLAGVWQKVSIPLGRGIEPINTSGKLSLIGPSSGVTVRAESVGTSLGTSHQFDAYLLASKTSIDVNSFSFRTPESNVSVTGTVSENCKLHWEIDSKDIGELLPLASGELRLGGSLTGPLSKPEVNLTAQANKLRYNTMQLSDLTMNGSVSVGTLEAPLFIDLMIGELFVDGKKTIADLSLSATGSLASHDLKFGAEIMGAGKARVELNGRLTPRNRSASAFGVAESMFGWGGQLTSLALDNTVAGDWMLEGQADLEYENGFYAVSPACLINGPQSICVEAQANNSQQSFSAGIAAVQLDNLNSLISTHDITLDGVLDGELTYQQTLGADHAVVVTKLKSKNGQIRWFEVEEESTDAKSMNFSNLSVTLEQSDELQISANFEFAQTGRISLTSKLSEPFGSADFEKAKLMGTSFLLIDDLDALPPSLSGDVDLNGKLDAELTLSGTVTNPEVSLNGGLKDAQLEIPELGVVLEQITLNAVTNNRSQIELDGSIKLGEGVLQLDGSMDLADFSQPLLKLDVIGNKLGIANSNELLVVGDVDLSAIINNKLAKVRGKVQIERAVIDLKLPETAILASNDVVLMGGEPQQNQLMQDIDVTIDLGQNTQIQAQGLDAMLTGSLRAYQSPESILRGDGRIDIINGRYDAYGQKLEIDQGRLVFNGGSIDDPGIQLRAQKTVDSITAGVQVSGRASAPTLNLYSNPTMSDQDVLSVLIFGKQIAALGSKDGLILLQIANSLRGDGKSTLTKVTQGLQNRLGLTDLQLNLVGSTPNIQAGKQLSSRFYVGYGYGLLDAAQSLILRYKLSDAWSIKADLGADSGADLRYQIDR